MLELPKANLQLGLRAFEYLIGREILRRCYAEIEAVDKAIILARQPIEKISSETMADKAARMALEAKRRLELESLQMTRRAKIAQLGASIADDPSIDQSNDLAELIANVQRLNATKLEIESKLERLTSQGWPWRRFIAVVGLIAIVMVGGYWFFRPLTASERLERAIARSKQELLAEQRAEWEEEEESLRNVELEAERATAKAAAEMERLEKEIQRRRERSDQSKSREELDESYLAATTKLESELRMLEMEEKERKKLTESRLQKEKEKAATQKSLEVAQDHLKNLCESLFEEIDLLPTRSVAVSKQLMENGVEVELRGSDIERIRSYLEERDWLSLINLLLQSSYVELPDADQVREAAERLRNFNFQILVKSTSPVVRQSVNRPELGRVLASVSVDIHGGLENLKVEANSDWTPHPDGIGFMQPWSPDRGRTVIAILPQAEIAKKSSEFQSLFASKLRYYEEKAKLGEISSEMLPSTKLDEVRALRDRVMAWALVRSESDQVQAGQQKDMGVSLFSIPKPGRYKCTFVDSKTHQKVEPQFLIFAEDIAGLVSGKDGSEISHLWIRHRSHPIERMGLYVYRLAEEVENGILVVQSFNGSAIVLSSYVGPDLETAEVLRDKSLSSKAHDIWGHWLEGGYRIDGVQNPPKKSSLPKNWRDLLTKHAPSCLSQQPKKRKVEKGSFECLCTGAPTPKGQRRKASVISFAIGERTDP